MGLFGSSKKKSTGIFVPDGRDFRELTDRIENGSINDIAAYLGYNTNQFHTFMGNWNEKNEIQTVVLKLFTTEILFVITLDSVTALTKRMVNRFMAEFRIDHEYDSVNVQTYLTEGITNRSLALDFLSQVLDFDPNDLDGGGIIFSKKLDLYLYFSNGILVDFSSSDGFTEWARFFKERNPGLFEDYVTAAETVWGSNTRNVQRMVNILSDSMAKTPDAFNNTFVEKHRDPTSGIINFRMLLVCHYNHPIRVEEFEFITKGQATMIPSNGDERFWYKNFMISFNEAGDLVEVLENPNR